MKKRLILNIMTLILCGFVIPLAVTALIRSGKLEKFGISPKYANTDKLMQGEYGPYVSHRYCYFCGNKLTKLEDFSVCPECGTQLDYDKSINSEVIIKYLEEVNK
jgi:hypothetical protein